MSMSEAHLPKRQNSLCEMLCSLSQLQNQLWIDLLVICSDDVLHKKHCTIHCKGLRQHESYLCFYLDFYDSLIANRGRIKA